LPNCCAEGCCTCRVPLYIYDVVDGKKAEEHTGKIVKIWGGMLNEMTGAHKFEVEFPPNSSNELKANLLGSTLLLNELYFKVEDKGN
jgi:hypothetical protein